MIIVLLGISHQKFIFIFVRISIKKVEKWMSSVHKKKSALSCKNLTPFALPQPPKQK